jgi:hypothetical protein
MWMRSIKEGLVKQEKEVVLLGLGVPPHVSNWDFCEPQVRHDLGSRSKFINSDTMFTGLVETIGSE